MILMHRLLKTFVSQLPQGFRAMAAMPAKEFLISDQNFGEEVV